MAVVTTNNPVIIPFGQEDLTLPIGKWACFVQSAGDLTGGNNTCVIAFSAAKLEQLVSIEGIMADVNSAGAARNILIEFVMQEPLNEGNTFTARFVLPGATLINSISVNQPIDNQLTKYIHNATAGAFSSNAVVSNTNGETLQYFLWGYLWSVQARRFSGEARRPSWG